MFLWNKVFSRVEARALFWSVRFLNTKLVQPCLYRAKVSYRVDIRATYRPVEFLNTILVQPCVYGAKALCRTLRFLRVKFTVSLKVTVAKWIYIR